MAIFISYSRKDTGLVRRLHTALAARQREIWVDWEGIPPSADWMREIEAAIDAAEAFVFVLSADAATSAVCLNELAHAVARNKRLLPVLCRDLDAARVPPALARLNWVWLREGDDFEAGVATLLEAVDTDLDWVHAHTRLLLRAVEWEARGADASLALQGSDLAAAEAWLARGPTKAPPPTELQTRFILDSRRQATRRRTRLMAAGALATGVIAVLGTLFVFQREATGRQAAVAVARRLASVSERLREQPSLGGQRGSPLETSLQLAAEGLHRLQAIGERSLEVDLALRRALALMPLAVPTAPPRIEPAYDFDRIVFSNGRLAAVSAGPFTTHAWDAAHLQALPGRAHGYDDTPRALSPDGGFVATTPRDERQGVIDIWALEGEAPLARLPGSGAHVVDVALSLGATQAALTTARFDPKGSWQDYATTLWRTRAPQVIARLPVLQGLHFSPDGRFFSGRSDGRLLVWEMPRLLAGELTPRLDLGRASWSEFSADGRQLLVVREGQPEGVEIWRTDDWERSVRLPAALAGTLAPGGRFMAVRDDSDSQLLHILEVATQKERVRLFAGLDHPEIAFSPDGERIAVGGIKRIAVWRIPEAGGASAHFAAAPATRIAFLADGRRLLLFDPAGLRRWDPGAPQAPAPAPLALLGAVQAAPADGRHLVLGNGAEARLIDVESGAPGRALTLPGPLVALALSPDARLVAAATDDRRLHLVQADSGALLASVALPGKARLIGLAASRGGEQVVALMQNPVSRVGQKLELVVWRRRATPPLTTLAVDRHGGLAATVCALGADGGQVAINNSRTSVQVRELREGKDLVTADEAGGSQRCVFSPDGRYLALTGAGATVRVWDVAAGAEIARLEGLPEILDLAISPDRRTLATLSADGSLQTWPLRYEELLAGACARLTRNLSDEDWARYIGGTRGPPACPARGLP